MTAPTITLGATTLFDAAATGIGFSVLPGVLGRDVVRKKVPVGDGYWLLDGGATFAEIPVEVHYKTNDVATLRSTLYGAISATLATLTLPDHGAFTNCRLAAVQAMGEAKRTDGSGYYLVSYTLLFEQYP